MILNLKKSKNFREDLKISIINEKYIDYDLDLLWNHFEKSLNSLFFDYDYYINNDYFLGVNQ